MLTFTKKYQEIERFIALFSYLAAQNLVSRTVGGLG